MFSLLASQHYFTVCLLASVACYITSTSRAVVRGEFRPSDFAWGLLNGWAVYLVSLAALWHWTRVCP